MAKSTTRIRLATADDIAGMQHVLLSCGLATDKDVRVIAGGLLIVAEDKGRVVGVMQTLLGFPCSFVSYLAVLPAHRRKGRTAFQLVSTTEGELKRLTIPHWLASIDDNDATWGRTLLKWGAVASDHPRRLYSRKLA